MTRLSVSDGDDQRTERSKRAEPKSSLITSCCCWCGTAERSGRAAGVGGRDEWPSRPPARTCGDDLKKPNGKVSIADVNATSSVYP